MTFIDTHCHLYDEAFDADRDQALQRALDAGVTTLLLPDIDSSSTPRLDALTLSARHSPLSTHPMAGLHPTSVKEDFELELQHVHDRLFGPGNPSDPDLRSHSSNSPIIDLRSHSLNSPFSFVAVGEIGMDLYWDRTYEAQQREVLRIQMRWAGELDLPVCLHIRKAYNEVFGLLRDLNRPRYRGVMHCFSGSVQEARRAVEMGFLLGIGGVVTFKNATMADVVKAVPLESLLLETDAPYLSPVPHRGQRNEPAYLPLVAQRIADLRGITLDEVADVTTASARALFAL
ncbi:MAG: TatD family hydrolase [Bacteroidales bacterium]|nr:TatD family hydrolase [Bacteroidales bacterium]